MKHLLPRLFPAFLFFVVSVFSPNHAYAQYCETETGLSFIRHFESITEHLKNQDYSKNMPVDVPVAFHVETIAGVPEISDPVISNAIVQVNAWFAAGNISFSWCGSSSFYYEQGTSATLINNVINVLIEESYSGCGVYVGSLIRINPTCNLPFDEILGHELGHYVGLPHTHGYTNNGTTTELADGSNCTTNGDRFCDTPADPNLLNLVNGSCIYTGTLMDANGDFYTPNTHNVMSYTRGGCRDHFTMEQLTKAHATATVLAYSCCLTATPVASGTNICKGNTASLTATAPAGVIQWFDAPINGTMLATGVSYTTPVLTTSTSYYLEAMDGCPSERISILVTVDPPSGVIKEIATLFKDMNPTGGSWAYNFVEAGGLLFFVANSGQLWRTDGTVSGTLMVYEFSSGAGNPQGDGAFITNMVELNGQLLIGLNDFAAGPSLWLSDGTTPGTQELQAFPLTTYGYSNFFMTHFSTDVLFLLGKNIAPFNAQIWKTNGTAAGTTLIKDLHETNAFADVNMTVLGPKFFFAASDSLNGTELWSSDGSTTNTSMLKDINPAGDSYPFGLTVYGGQLFFAANDGINGNELWRSDGTLADTQIFTDLHPTSNSNPGSFMESAGFLYFSATDDTNGTELFRTDGTPGGTGLVANINTGGSSFPSGFTNCNGALYFTANDGLNGMELWKTDPVGVVAPIMIKNINPSGSASVNGMACIDNLLFFSANDGINGNELWRSDGTESGTFMLANLNPSTSSSPNYLTSYNNSVYFTANDGSVSNEMWKLDIPNYQVCPGSTASLIAGNTMGTVDWFDAPSGGTFLFSGTTYETSPLFDDTDFFAEYALNGCISDRAAYNVTVLSSLDPQCLSLAVEWLSFNVHLQGRNTALLKWETATETANQGFYIEHLVENEEHPHFKQVGFVPGNGTSQHISTYGFEVPDLIAGKHYFRLQQEDFTGEFSASPVRMIEVTGSPGKVYPNLLSSSTHKIYIEPAVTGQVELKIMDPLGRIVNHQVFNVRFEGEIITHTLETEKWSPGFYFLSLITPNGTMVEKLVYSE